MNENVRNLLQGYSHERRKRHRPKPLLLRVAKTLIGLLLFITAILTFSIYTPFFSIPLIEWFTGNQLFRFILTGASVIILLHYLTIRHWRLIVVAALTLIILSCELFRNIPLNETTFDTKFSKPFSVLTFNTKFYTTHMLTLLIKDRKHDLICFQEVKSFDFNERIKKSKDNKWLGYFWYFGSYTDQGENGVLVLCKEPVEPVKLIDCPSHKNDRRLYHILKTKQNGKDTYIIPLHLEPVEIGHGLTGLIDSWKVRLIQAKMLADEIDRINAPLVVLGDFNTTPTDRIFRIICSNLKDSWVKTGKLLGRTWHREAPLFRIDYILYKDFKASANGKVLPYRYSSDHFIYRVDLF
ncbi:endonuclease/exonuclease/phosphatase family protein [bacterium]|nr:endonuclease/exonuclease/phosphatase family protein [bacterium]